MTPTQHPGRHFEATEGSRLRIGRRTYSARSARLLSENNSSLSTAETLAGAVHSGVEHGRPRGALRSLRRQWASRHVQPCPWTDEQLLYAIDSLRELDDRWQSRGPDEAVDVAWPPWLTSTVPRAPHVPRSRPRSRR